MIKFLSKIYLILSCALALGACAYVMIMGKNHFNTLTSEQVSFLQSILTLIIPFVGAVAKEIITEMRNKKQDNQKDGGQS